MRHPHGLRAAAAAAGGIAGPAIGDSYGGGFFAGYISHTANSVATHALIVAPLATGGAFLRWKLTRTSTPGTTNLFDGAVNSANMNNADHPAAQFCEALSIGGYTDWYLPARYELDIAYENLKPSTQANFTSYGINPYSVPARTVNRTAGVPAQTTVAAFQTGGGQAFPLANHFTSTEATATNAWRVSFLYGTNDSGNKATSNQMRAFRKVAL